MTSKIHIGLAASMAMMALQPVASAQGLDQFDLICTGTSQKNLRSQPERWSIHLDIDLAKGQFCFHGCKGPANIVRVEASTITFVDSKGPDGISARLFVNRADGSISEFDSAPSIDVFRINKGKCEVAPFTPFPKLQF